MKRSSRVLIAVLGLFFSVCSSSPKPELRIAVASNFKDPAAEIVKRFEERTGANVTISLGSTGRLYAQITNGAPFDVFLSADSETTARLENETAAAKGTRFTYAVGKIVLWSPEEGVVDANGDVLRSGDFGRIAIANPKVAPYGRAAEETLRQLGLWEKLQDGIARGENIGQTFQFVSTGSAEIGFVALSQIRDKGGSQWEVPQELYSPIEQQAVLLNDKEDAREFFDFLKSEEAQDIIRKYGYDVR